MKQVRRMSSTLKNIDVDDKVHLWCQDPTTFVARCWYCVITCTFFGLITTVLVLGQSSSGEASWTAIWTCFMSLGVAVGGTLSFRKFQTPSAIGFLLGVCFMMSQLYFTLFVVFLGFSSSEELGGSPGVDRTYASFAFFLMIDYALMTYSIAKYRSYLIPTTNTNSLSQNADPAPTPAPTTTVSV